MECADHDFARIIFSECESKEQNADKIGANWICAKYTS